MSKQTVCILLAFLLGSMVSAAPAGADYYTLTLPTLDTDIATWSDGGTYNLYFPGSHTWNGVPFVLENRTPGNYKASISSLTIPVGVYGVTEAYTIINTAWGTYGAVVGKVEFNGTGGAYYSMDLTEGINVRDHYWGSFNNVIDGIHAKGCFDYGSWRARLDMQIFTLPAEFAHETLLNMVFTNSGGYPQGSPFIAAATVSAIPLPGTLLLLGSGLLGVAALKKRSAG